jgi:hypothetical protein
LGKDQLNQQFEVPPLQQTHEVFDGPQNALFGDLDESQTEMIAQVYWS